MELRDALCKELVKKGYSERSDGRKIWNVANRSFLYMTSDLAESFLKVRSHPRYNKTIVEIESKLLKGNVEKFVGELIDRPFNLIDMGCGDGSKARVFLESLKGGSKLRFCPVNSNKYLVDLALKNIKDSNFESVLEYYPHVSDLSSLHEVASMMRNGEYQKNVILLLGSILASFEIHEYLFNLSRAMFNGDRLIIGNGIREGERFAGLETYKHPLFIDWFSHLIRGLGFEDGEVEYDARFENGRVECFYKLNSDKKIVCGDREIEFKKGDEVLVAILYKYYEDELKEVCQRYFRDVELVRDPESEYALVLCVK